MIGTFIGILFLIVIIGVIWWAVFHKLLPLIPLPEPFATIVYVLCVVVLVIIVLGIISMLLGMVGIQVPTIFKLR